MVFDNIQNFCGEIKESACYALCLVHVGQQYNQEHNPGIKTDVVEVLYSACTGTKDSDIIYFNHNDINYHCISFK